MAATPTSLTLERRLRRQLDQILDAQTRDLVRAWAIAWDEIAPELRDTLAKLLADSKTATVSRRDLDRSRRLQAALAVVADNLGELAPAAGVRINQDLDTVVEDAAKAQARILAAQLPPVQHLVDMAPAWTKRDLEPLQAIVRRSAEQITALHKPLAPQAYQAVRRELVRSVAVGANPRATAARMVRRAEGEFNGGLTRALTISRTEVLDAQRAGAAAGQDRHTEVLQGWVWLCHLSPRTCRACLAMNGREFPLEVPGPIGHQQCRCTRSPLVKSWADLGFDVVEPPSVFPDAEAYFARLPVAQQRSILGQRGYDAWVVGDFPMDRWAKLRKGEGWRDSVVPASPAAPGSGGDGNNAGDGPPGSPPSAPLDDSHGGLPIGPVLGDEDQQTYFRGPHNPIPSWYQLDLDAQDANNAFTFVPDPDARATAILQYEASTATLAKDLSAYLHMGEAPDEDWHLRAADVYFHQVVPSTWYGVEADGSNYTLDDFITDLTFTADWLLQQLDRPKVLPDRIFRGLLIKGEFDLADTEDVARLAAAVIQPIWLASATEFEDFAIHYATRRTDGFGGVVIEIHGASGIQLDPMGRMSTAAEFLLEGALSPVTYWVDNGVLYILASYQQ